jgi:hypothetical protein
VQVLTYYAIKNRAGWTVDPRKPDSREPDAQCSEATTMAV